MENFENGWVETHRYARRPTARRGISSKSASHRCEALDTRFDFIDQATGRGIIINGHAAFLIE
ncbi:MAG: hypothetical protein MUO63_19820 [Desulfobulbaceae bacterium]|nr:hypothetical protein [Desulfobulbaceae bacterium]